MGHQWAVYPHDTRYEVSTHGEVRMEGRRVRKPSCTPTGYHVIVVTGERGKRKGYYVHRMVLETFVGDCPPDCMVSHLNGCCSDNRLDNLCYETLSTNQLRKRQHGTHFNGERCPTAKLTNVDANLIRTMTETCQETAARFGVSPTTVSRIRRGLSYRQEFQ